jgi:hypothetical protein
MHDELLTRSRVRAGQAQLCACAYGTRTTRRVTEREGRRKRQRRQPDSRADADPNDGHASHQRSTASCC